MVIVYPGAMNPTHEISLSDGIKTWGLSIDTEGSVVKEEPITQTKINIPTSEHRYGDFEPGISYAEQRSWLGGMGKNDFFKDQDGFAEGINIWSIAEGKLMPAPQWEYARGLNKSIEKTPGNMSWIPFRSDQAYISFPILIEDGNLDVKHVNLWVKKAGEPGDLIVSIYSGLNDSPDQLVSGTDVKVSDFEIAEYISQWALMTFPSGVTLNNNSTYHVVINPEQSGTAASHWLLGVDKQELKAKSSSDGSDWNNAEFSPYFRLSEESIDRRWQFFNYLNSLYAVDQRDDGTASSLFINGDRGKATGGDSLNIYDTDKNWGNHIWVGARVKIIKGTGKGQSRNIISNGSGNLVVDGWNINPDSSSEYVINATEIWQDITPSSGDLIDGVVVDTCVIDETVILAQGVSTNILKMRWNGSANPPVHEFSDDGTNRADMVHCFHDRENGLRLWKALNDSAQIMNAVPVNWGTTHSYGSSILVGSSSEQIFNLFEHDGSLRVFKTDGLFEIFSDYSVQKVVSDINYVDSDMNGGLCLSRRKDLYFRWGKGDIFFAEGGVRNNDVVRIDSPFGNDGKDYQISALIGHPKGFLTAVDRGEYGYSSVNIFLKENQSWHEIFRSPNTGQKINNLHWQDCGENGNRLWVSCGGEIIFIDWPKNENDPSKDDEMKFQHESILVTSVYDLGTARIQKLFKELTLITRNLVSGTEIHVDYQSDSEIGSSSWIRGGIIFRSSEDCINLNLGGKKQIRFRFRLVSSYSQQPAIILASVLEAFTRTPLKYQWGVKMKANQQSEEFLSWLKESAEGAKSLTMRSIWGDMDRKSVVVEPPSIEKMYKNDQSGSWDGTLYLKLKEF